MVDKKTGVKPKAKDSKTKKASPKKEVVKEIETPVEIPLPLSETTQQEITREAEVAKAGRRSAKAIKEAEEKQVKEERKAKAADQAAEQKPKQPQKPARTRTERAGKKFKEAAKLIEREKVYSLAEALDLATKTSITKFDASVELHVNLGVDPKQPDHNIRATVVLPAGTGKTLRVAVLAEAEDVEKAKEAGADIAGSDELLQQLDKEELGFDVLIAIPALMPKLAKYAKLLGPKGLMPNPKSGTVTADVAKAVAEAKAGKVEYRTDPAGIIHLAIGKVSFGADKLLQNAEAILKSIRTLKPASLKGAYIETIYITTSMGPSIRTQIS